MNNYDDNARILALDQERRRRRQEAQQEAWAEAHNNRQPGQNVVRRLDFAEPPNPNPVCRSLLASLELVAIDTQK